MVKIDTKKCIGCGSCTAVCPEGFEMKNDGKAYVKDAKVKCIKDAINICPVEAIKE